MASRPVTRERGASEAGGDRGSAGASASGAFRFAVGEHVWVITHPARPLVAVTARWRGPAFEDVYDQNIYAVSGFVTRQRESNLGGDGFVNLPLEASSDWQMAGRGAFRRVGPGTVQSEGGPGIWWYTRERFADFVLLVDWRVSKSEDNSGVFIRIPALGRDDPENDWRAAVAEGYEIQIDERGVDPATGLDGSARHLTRSRAGRVRPGAILRASDWNFGYCFFSGAGGAGVVVGGEAAGACTSIDVTTFWPFSTLYFAATVAPSFKPCIFASSLSTSLVPSLSVNSFPDGLMLWISPVTDCSPAAAGAFPPAEGICAMACDKTPADATRARARSTLRTFICPTPLCSYQLSTTTAPRRTGRRSRWAPRRRRRSGGRRYTRPCLSLARGRRRRGGR